MKLSVNEIKQIMEQKLRLKTFKITDFSLGYDQDVWKVETSMETLILKCPKKHNLVRNQREKLSCSLMAEKGLIAPNVLYMDENVLIETFIVGTLVSEVDFSNNESEMVYRKIGETLSKMHEIKGKNYGLVMSDQLIGENLLEEYEEGFLDELKILKQTHFYSEQDLA
jgi:fructosamine-3-kinase